MSVFGVTVGAFLLAEILQSLRTRRGATRVNLAAELLLRLTIVAAVLALAAARALVPQLTVGGRWLFVAGVVVTWLGLLLRWWSFLTLGRYFTVVVQTSADQPVIDTGPYRRLRHPSYTGLLAAIGGCGLMVGNLAGTAAAVALVAVALVHRIGIEERALLAALGEPYRAFAAGRARLVPFVW